MLEIFAGLCFTVSVSICTAGFSACKLFVMFESLKITADCIFESAAGIVPVPWAEGVRLFTLNPSFIEFSKSCCVASLM